MKRITINLVLPALIAFGLSAAPIAGQSQQDPAAQQPPLVPPTKFRKAKNPFPNYYIVVLNDDVAPDNLPLEVRRARVTAIAKRHARVHGGTVIYIYETALKGYSIKLPDEAAAIAISKLRCVKWVAEDSLGKWF